MANRAAQSSLLVCAVLCLTFAVPLAADESSGEVTLLVQAANHASHRIPRNLTGKFCEHLGANIYNGMDAQILRNPTFADYPFATGQTTPDGLVTFQFEQDKIDTEARRDAARWGWPADEVPEMLTARRDGLACFWSRAGQRDVIEVSPDTGPKGGRAQRIEFKAAGGLKQWIWLPLHRTRAYEFEVLARSPDLTHLRIAIISNPVAPAAATASTQRLKSDWVKLQGRLELSSTAARDSSYCMVLSTETPGQLVLAHVFLRPADHIAGADPDVVRLLKASQLPLLRWPGGNFVSAYHWEDGIGPVESRPTRPNYAWGGVEPNTFGTDEFVAFCRAVGCEPMICINAGTGTTEEAARWIQYCNGAPSSPMGARRVANGHRNPYNIRHWEVGNELWGHWQADWTTAEGYVDRYRRFAHAMLQADPGIKLYACGAPVLWGKAWNETLISRAGASIRSLTDHPLIGGNVALQTDPLDVFRDFMLVPDILEKKWAKLGDDMDRRGIREPRLAITELQMFAHLGSGSSEGSRLNRQNLVNPGTLGEALYDTLIYHAAARQQPLVELVTHSATVNHGGGLRKERERVYANPCYYANRLFAAFAEATPVSISLQTPLEHAPKVLPDIKNFDGETSFGALAALSALDARGGLLISLVHRGTAGPLRVTIQFEGFRPGATARLETISGSFPWSVNSLDQPEAIRPNVSAASLDQGRLVLSVRPFSVVQARLRPDS